MRPFISLLFLSIIFVGCGQTEQISRSPIDGLEFPEPKTPVIPDVERFSYNGIEFFLLQDSELPLITVNVLVNGGSWLDPDDRVGTASITGTVLRSGGSATYPDEELNELLENRAASMETGFGLLSGSAQMNVLKEDFDYLLPVFTDLLKNPLFPQERIDLAKTRQRTAISRRNEEASSIASREFRNLVYGSESVYARNIEYATLENISRDNLIEFHSKVYNGSNMLVGIIGDFEPHRIQDQLKAAFKIFDEGSPVSMDIPEVDYSFESGLFLAHKDDMTQSQIRMGHIGGFRDNPDYAALQIMNQILSGGFSGRLMQEVRTERGLAYGVYGSYTSNVRYPGIFFAGLSTAAETTLEAINATREQIVRLQNEPVSQEELDETKERIFNRIIFRYDSYTRILAERISNYNLGLPEDAFEQYIEQVRKVTVDDIYRVANEYLQPGKMKILVVGNRNLIQEQLDELGGFEEIDFSIPRPSIERLTVDGDRVAGKTLIQKMSRAILEEGTSFDALTLEGTQYMVTPQGEMPLQLTSTLNFPDGMRMEISTPMGNQIIDISNGQGLVQMGGQEQPLPESFVESILLEIKRDPVNIALNAADLDAVLLESNDDAHIIYVGGDFDMTIHLGSENHLPVEILYSQFNPQEGREVDVMVSLHNWTLRDGVRIAYSQERYSDGELVSRNQYSGHRTGK